VSKRVGFLSLLFFVFIFIFFSHFPSFSFSTTQSLQSKNHITITRIYFHTSHHNHKNTFYNQKNTSHNNKFQKNTSHNYKFHIIQSQSPEAEQAAPRAAGRPAWPPHAAWPRAPPGGRPGPAHCRPWPRAPPGVRPCHARRWDAACGLPKERREGEREDERTEWRGRRSGEERMMMRLGLVSGGVDILRTMEDFFGWHG